MKEDNLPSSPTLHQMVGQSFMPAAFINDTEEAIRATEILIEKYHIGGLCFFHSPASAATNFEGKKEVIYNARSEDVLLELIERYSKVASSPLLFSIDAEWGMAMRVENTPAYPYALTLGAIVEQDELVEEVGFRIGVDCRNLGIHWNFAPVADCNTNPENPVIGFRSFGEDRQRVAAKAKAFARGLNRAGILNCIKHFPGHGDTKIDSHLGLPLIDKSLADLNDNELYPFKECIEAGVDAVMIGHLAVPAIDRDESVPSSLSRAVITNVLKEQWGFEGIVVTDALNMKAVTSIYEAEKRVAVEAYKAGNDILCFPIAIEEAIEEILRLVPKSVIQTRYRRVAEFKNRAFKMQPQGVENSRNRNDLLDALAENSLSWFHEKEEVLEKVKSTSFLGIYAGGDQSLFLNKTRDALQHPTTNLADLNREEILELSDKYSYILLALYPPRLRPKGKFGFSDEELTIINLLVKSNRVLLYHFGNPYALNLLNKDNFEGIVIAYQDFPEFQRNAALHFLGKSEAKGRLPVKLN